jgi:hypothetical protein
MLYHISQWIGSSCSPEGIIGPTVGHIHASGYQRECQLKQREWLILITGYLLYWSRWSNQHLHDEYGLLVLNFPACYLASFSIIFASMILTLHTLASILILYIMIKLYGWSFIHDSGKDSRILPRFSEFFVHYSTTKPSPSKRSSKNLLIYYLTIILEIFEQVSRPISITIDLRKFSKFSRTEITRIKISQQRKLLSGSNQLKSS